MTSRGTAIAILLVLSLVAVACGGGDSTSEDATTTSTSAPAGDGGDGNTGGDSTTTTEAVSGDSGSDWCEGIRDLEATGESPVSFDFFNLTREQIEAQFERNLEIFASWVDRAPSEIEDDAEFFLASFQTLLDRGKALEWDIAALADDAEFAAAFDNPDFEAAADRIDAYNRDVCGIDFAVSADPGTTPPGNGGEVDDDPIAIALSAFQLPAGFFSEDDIECLREEVGEEFEASIVPGWVPTQDDITILLDALEACELGLTP